MEIIVNDSKQIVSNDCTIISLIEELNLTITIGMAIAINDTVVPKIQWKEHTLSNADNVLIIKATQGG